MTHPELTRKEKRYVAQAFVGFMLCGHDPQTLLDLTEVYKTIAEKLGIFVYLQEVTREVCGPADGPRLFNDSEDSL